MIDRELLGRANKAHTLTVVSIVVAVARVEVRTAEVHVVRGVATIARSRPVVAVGTDVVNIRPVTPARSRQGIWQTPALCAMQGSPRTGLRRTDLFYTYQKASPF